MHSLRNLFARVRSARRARLFLTVFAVANQLTMVGYAAAPAVVAMPALDATRSVCAPDGDCSNMGPDPSAAVANLALPTGLQQCADSGPAAACSTAAAATDSQAGAPALPAGTTACPASDTKILPGGFLASCTEVPTADASAGRGAASTTDPGIQPSVSIPPLGGRRPTQLTLAADFSAVRAGKPAVITAYADATVTGTDVAIEIFDETARVLIGACAQGSRCSVAYAATSGTHGFVAFVTPPTAQIPTADVALSSNHVSVGWLDSTIAADRTVLGPGQAVTLTATSTLDVRQTGRWLELYDITDDKRLTFCRVGTSCTTTMKQAGGGTHEIVGYVTGKPEAVSAPVYVTWLAVSLSAVSIGPKTGGTVYLRANTNADLAGTPWVVGIYDAQGQLVDHACKSGSTCIVTAWMSAGTTPTYTAIIGALPLGRSVGGKLVHAATASGRPDLVDVQAMSGPIQPTHLLWGVDSCKAMTGDPSGQELFPQVVSRLGTPEFWGRYLTDTICPGLSASEVALAARNHMGILPIYNDYDCSNVSYYATGHQYAVTAAAAAARIGISAGRLIAIDIEPYGAQCPGAANVDSGFIEGWYDGIHAAGYVPAYYGNGTAGSEFANAWCATVSALPHIAQGSDLWSFEPSFLGGYAKPTAPNFGPYDTGCAGNMLAWQYQIGSNSSYAEVDHDEALSSLPLWYPS